MSWCQAPDVAFRAVASLGAEARLPRNRAVTRPERPRLGAWHRDVA